MEEIKKIAIIFLLFAITVSLVSCNSLTDLYDKINGIDGPGATESDAFTVKWVETYDEMVDIANKMKSSGTEVPQFIAFDCEEDGIDVKFRIILSKSDVEKIEDGQSFYDIKLSYVDIKCYIFSENISIAELEKYELSSPLHYHYTIEKYNKHDVIQSVEGANDLRIDRADPGVAQETGRLHVFYFGKYQFYLQKGDQGAELTDEQIEVLEKTLVVI